MFNFLTLKLLRTLIQIVTCQLWNKRSMCPKTKTKNTIRVMAMHHSQLTVTILLDKSCQKIPPQSRLLNASSTFKHIRNQRFVGVLSNRSKRNPGSVTFSILSLLISLWCHAQRRARKWDDYELNVIMYNFVFYVLYVMYLNPFLSILGKYSCMIWSRNTLIPNHL